jgi:hypothetical protein
VNGITPVFRNYAGNNPIAFVTARKIHRQHLTPSERAMFRATMEKHLVGKFPHPEETPIREKAREAKVDRKTMVAAEAVVNKGSRALNNAVVNGKASVAIFLAHSQACHH